MFEDRRLKDPLSLTEAQDMSDWKNWEKAIHEELNQLQDMGTWKLVDLPEGREAVGNKWVFVRKRDEHGNVARYKAWLVTQGFSQKPGIDYNKTGTFSPVMRLDTLRTMLTIAAIENLDIQQIDIKGAYLNGNLKETVYMHQPVGYKDKTGRVCRLQRPLYGLKQAGNVWNEEFDETMKELGYKRLCTDYCTYVKKTDNDLSILIIWVDDIDAFARKRSMNDWIISKLKEKYTVSVLGEPTLVLGIHIKRDRKNQTITMSQKRYIQKILEKARMKDAKLVSTLMDPNVMLCENDVKKDEYKDSHTSIKYAAHIGKLLYAAHATRPDILYTTITLAQFTSNPSPTHWTALKRVFRYLQGSIDLELTFDKARSSSIELERFADADWGSSHHRKSINGYVFTIGGGAVAWSSKKQTRIALSTAEAEYNAAVHATKQVIWQRNLYKEIGLPYDTPSIIKSDNQATISISHHPEYHARTKHVDIDLHFLRDYVEEGTIKLEYVPSAENLADLFTKALSRPAHVSLTRAIGLLPGQGECWDNAVSGQDTTEREAVNEWIM